MENNLKYVCVYNIDIYIIESLCYMSEMNSISQLYFNKKNPNN